MKTTLILALTLVTLMTGCRTPASRPAVDLSEKGWRMDQAQILWTPRPKGDAWVGELLVASNPDGRRLVQFSKSGLPAMTAQVGSNSWWFDAPLFHIRHSGVGAPPKDVLWFHLTQLPPVPPLPAGWSRNTSSQTPGEWTLTHRRTGETLQGFAP